MDIYRTSDIHQSSINRSFVSQSRMRSTLESTIEYQNSQVSLFKIMKYLFLILFIASGLLVMCMFLDRSDPNATPIDKKGWSSYDNIKYSLFDIVPRKEAEKTAEVEIVEESKSEPGFLDNLKDIWFTDKTCNQLKELEDKLKAQRFSVQRHVDSLPSLEDIKTNRGKYELSNELNRSCLEGELDFASPMFTTLISNFDQLIGVGHLNLSSSQDDFTALSNQLERDEGRYKDAELLLDNDFIYGVKSNVNNLLQSHKNIQKKKIMLNGYRHNLFMHMKQLESIINDIKKAKGDSEREKDREIVVLNKLGEAEALVNKLDKQVKEREASMGDGHQKQLAELRQVSDRIDEIKASIVNSDRIRADCRTRKDRIAKSESAIAASEAKITDLEAEAGKLQANRKDRINSIKSLQDNNEIYENRKKIHSIKLEVLLRNKEIKAFLDKIINSHTNIDNLADLMNNKITDEEKLMLLMNTYNEESAKIDASEGETLIDTETVTSDQVKIKIEKDRNDFKQIMEKFLGLKKVVEEYEDPDLEINNLKIKIQDIDGTIRRNSQDQSNIKKDVERLDRQIAELDNNLRNLKDKNSGLKASIEQDEQYINDKENHLNNAEKELKDLNDQKAILDEKYKVI